MIIHILRRFVCITLFIQFCLPFSAVSAASQQKELPVSAHSMLDRDTFETIMTNSRKHAEAIGNCIQQILLTVDASKLKLTKTEQEHIKSELQQLLYFTQTIINQIYTQNTNDALAEGILLNNTLINFLLSTMQKGIKTINIQALVAKMQKNNPHDIPQQILLNMFEKNNAKIEKLVYATEHIGLTWHHFFYRSLKKYNAYSIAKGCVIVAATAALAGFFLCISDAKTGIEWIDKRIGPSVKFSSDGEYYHKDTKDPDTKAIKRGDVADYSNSTIFQSAVKLQHKFAQSGLVSAGALISFSYRDLIAGMYKDTYRWIAEKGVKKAIEYDQRLSGTAKHNTAEQGYEKVYFKDLVGCEELEQLARKLANFMKHPERYERAQIEEHRGILLYGPSQTGKSQFAKALRTMIEDEMGQERVPFINGKYFIDLGQTVEYVFWYASHYAPCILFFDEIDLIGANREKSPITTSQLLTCMQGMDMSTKPIIVIGATNRIEQLDKHLLVDGRFGKQILVDYPKYEHRKQYLKSQLDKRCIQLTPEYVDCIAQETEGCTYNNLKRIITEAIILSSIEMRPVQQKDFERTLDTEIRKMLLTNTMNKQEREIVATYQAGKALARHLLSTSQEVVKVTINPVSKEVKASDVAMIIENSDQKNSENDKLALSKKDQKLKHGEVFTKKTSNHSDLLSDDQHEQECLALLAGPMALKLIFGKTYAECNKQDRAEAMQIIYNFLTHGEKINEKTTEQALRLKDVYEQKVYALLQQNKDLLLKISNVLQAQSTIDRYEWKKIVA